MAALLDCDQVAELQPVDTSMVITAALSGITVTVGNVKTPALMATWTPPESQYVVGIQFEYVDPQGRAVQTQSQRKDKAIWQTSDGIVAGAVYQVRYRATGIEDKAFGDWSPYQAIQIPAAFVAGDTAAIAGIPASTITARLVTVEGVAAANATAVADLETIYGDTASAAASAAAAAQAKADAILAKSDAVQAKSDAVAAAGASASSASQAGGFKTAAETASAAAASSQVSASTSATAATSAAVAVIPDTISAALWALGQTAGAPASRASISASEVVDGAFLPSGTSRGGPKQYVRWETGRIYELTFTVSANGGAAANARIAVDRRDATYGALTTTYGPVTMIAAGSEVTITRRFGFGVTPIGGTGVARSDAEWVAFSVQGNINASQSASEPGATQLFKVFKIRDVTALAASEASASASATSAANASASETAAGLSATASQTARTGAETARGQAEAYRNETATSRDTAVGAAATATQQAGLATTAKDQAAGSASAAAGSASTASTKAGEAGTSAAAALASQVSATTARDRATESASNASYLDVGAAFTFANTVDGWGAANGSLSASPSGALFVQSGTDPQLIRSGLAILGSRYTRVIVTLTRTKARASGAWDGTLYFATDSHGFSGSFRQIVTRDPPVGERTELTWDMPSLPYGGTDWLTSTIRQIRLDLDQGPGGEFTIHGVRVVGADTAAPSKSASAAATSASLASASETAAGQKASAAEGSATTAATRAGEAKTFRDQSAVSEANAAGYSQTAQAASGTSVSARDDSQAARDQSQAAAATAIQQKSEATAAASSAQISASLAAQVGQGVGYHKNPTWLDWSVGSLPPSSQSSGAVTTARNTASARYGVCLEVNSNDGSNGHVELQVGRFATPGPVTHVVIEYEVLLQGGSFRRSGLQGSIQDGGVDRNAIVHLFDEHGVGVAGQTYSGAKLVKLPTAATAPNGVRLYLFNNFSDLSGGVSGGKNLRWQRVNLRAATSAEIESQKVGGLEAQLQVTASTTADLATRMATAKFEVIAAAGNDPAQLLIRADSTGSLAAMVASAIRFSNVVGGQIVEAMKLIGGEVFFMRPIYIDVGSSRLIVGPGNGWVLWFGGTDKTAAQATRTNGSFALGTDGRVYLANEQLQNGGAATPGSGAIAQGNFSAALFAGSWDVVKTFTVAGVPANGYGSVGIDFDAPNVSGNFWGGDIRLVETATGNVIATSYVEFQNLGATGPVNLSGPLSRAGTVEYRIEGRRSAGSGNVNQVTGRIYYEAFQII